MIMNFLSLSIKSQIEKMELSLIDSDLLYIGRFDSLVIFSDHIQYYIKWLFLTQLNTI
jgi:hypothetical protein